MVEMVAGPVSSGMPSGTTATEAPDSALARPWSASPGRLSPGRALSMFSEDTSSSMPPPTWKDATEMPKKAMIFRPAMPLMAMTAKAVSELTRIVRRRSWGVSPWVKWMKNGTAPIGLTIASSAIRGLIRSMRSILAATVRTTVGFSQREVVGRWAWTPNSIHPPSSSELQNNRLQLTPLLFRIFCVHNASQPVVKTGDECCVWTRHLRLMVHAGLKLHMVSW